MTAGSQNHGVWWWTAFFNCSGPASLFGLCRAGEEMEISSPDPSAGPKVRGEAPYSDGIQQNSSGWTSASKGFPRQTFRLVPLNFSHLWVSDISMMEKCMMSRDCGICTGKDVCPGRMCLCSAGEQQRLHKLNLFQQLIHFSIITGSLEVGGKRRMNLDDFPWFERQDK